MRTHTERQTEGQIDRRRGSQIGRGTGGHIGRRTGRQTDGRAHTHTQTHRHKDTKMDIYAGRQADKIVGHTSRTACLSAKQGRLCPFLPKTHWTYYSASAPTSVHSYTAARLTHLNASLWVGFNFPPETWLSRFLYSSLRVSTII